MSVFSAALPEGAAGAWCRILVRCAGAGGWWAKLEAADLARGQVVREAFAGPARRRGGQTERSVLLHLPSASEGVTLTVFSEGGGEPALFVRPLGRRRAAVALLAQGWRKLPAAVRGDRRGVLGRARAILGQAPARGGEAPPYAAWIDLFDRWGKAELAALAMAGSSPVLITVALVANGDQAALAASQRSVPTQWRVHVITNSADWAALTGAWVLVLAAGEVLAPHAGACFSHAARTGRGICADIDHLGPNGQRIRPHFRPPPDPWLLRSGFFARGAFLFHKASHDHVWTALPADADVARQALACAGPAETLVRLPLILTHCPDGAETFQPALTPPAPVQRDAVMVSIIIPSACRSHHVLRCLQLLLRETTYPSYEVLLAVASVDEADRRQAWVLHKVASLPRVRVLDLGMAVFNYAVVNNKAAAEARGNLLLLLNDDVVPILPDWLGRMVAHVCNPERPVANIVGARLLYGNSMVQHGGVIMGLANLCEHAFRLADRGDSGAQGLAKLDRQVSAVTGACMLVTKQLFESLGGMDEAFAIALNDVDFCLRAGRAGARIVLAAGVELYHFESMSLGRHYQGTRAQLEALEVRRLRDRWAVEIACDPWYHPCASLELGREFEPGFPPRQTPLSWIRQEPLAPH